MNKPQDIKPYTYEDLVKPDTVESAIHDIRLSIREISSQAIRDTIRLQGIIAERDQEISELAAEIARLKKGVTP
jgi:hypothetical protein